MYIHLGNGRIVREKEVIGVFDLDLSTLSKTTRAFLSQAEKEGRLEITSDEIPRSVIITEEKIYMSVLSPKAICGRMTKK